MRTRKLTPWIAVGIALTSIAVIVFGVATYRNTAAVRQSEALVARSYAVREKTRALLSSVKDMETGQRGFLITGATAYLAPYRSGLADVDEEFASLEQLTASHPEQQRRVEKLRELFEAKRATLAEGIAERNQDPNSAGLARAREIILKGRGNSLMEEMRSVAGDILAEERRMLEEWNATANSRATLTERFIVSGNVLTLTLLVISGVVAHIDRKRRDEAETQLRSSQEELAAIFDSAGDGILTFNDDLKIRLMNPAAARMHRCRDIPMRGRSYLDFVPPRFREFVANDVRDFLQSDAKNRTFTTRPALRSDGSEFPCKGSLTKPAAEKDSQFVTLMLRDLSESRDRDAKIHEQVEILNQVRDAILVCDLDDRIVSWNRGAELLYGYSATEAIGQNVIALLFGSHREVWETGTKTVLQGGVWITEVPQSDREEREFIVEHRRSLICDDVSHAKAQLILHFDITNRKRDEVLQRRSQRLASIGTLAGGIAHDLNNVLTPILMSAKLMKRGGEHHERLLDAIVTSAERGGKMIHKLLSFAGGGHGVRERIVVREILGEAEEILKHTLPKTVDLEVECADDLHDLSGDATELSQVLMNLAINARDAMPDGGRLILRAENCILAPSGIRRSDTLQAGPHVLIQVSDNGTGISAEHLESIFDPFFTTKPQGKGTGLGLATSLGIVRSHGGDITVSSQLGKGTAFSIYLPVGKPTRATTTPGITEHLLSGNGATILLVDDEPLIVETAAATLEASGYVVTKAVGGEEAIAYFQQNPASVDVILLDMMMPDMDGFATKTASGRSTRTPGSLPAAASAARPRKVGDWPTWTDSCPSRTPTSNFCFSCETCWM